MMTKVFSVIFNMQSAEERIIMLYYLLPNGHRCNWVFHCAGKNGLYYRKAKKILHTVYTVLYIKHLFEEVFYILEGFQLP